MRHDGPDPGRPGILSGKVLIVVPLISGANPSPPTRHPEGTRPLGAGRGESDLTPAKTPGLCAGRGGEGIEQAGSAMERAGGAEWCRRVGESGRDRTWRTWRTWRSWRTSQGRGERDSSRSLGLGASIQNQRPLGTRSLWAVAVHPAVQGVGPHWVPGCRHQQGAEPQPRPAGGSPAAPESSPESAGSPASQTALGSIVATTASPRSTTRDGGISHPAMLSGRSSHDNPPDRSRHLRLHVCDHVLLQLYGLWPARVLPR
jgi:hypothetical protein